MVVHKKYGEGKIINRDVNKNGTYVTVEFECGKVMTLAIPASFTVGAVEATGALKEEVDKAIEFKKSSLAQQQAVNTPKITTLTSKSKNKIQKKSWTPSCSLASEYEKYLIDHRYSVESDSGNPSTVYSYCNAVECVASNEGISWNTLAQSINNIIPKYDVGGIYETLGLKSNKTVINALKRFGEMVNP